MSTHKEDPFMNIHESAEDYSVLISALGQRKGNASMRCTEEHSVRECAEKGAAGSNEDPGNKRNCWRLSAN